MAEKLNAVSIEPVRLGFYAEGGNCPGCRKGTLFRNEEEHIWECDNDECDWAASI